MYLSKIAIINYKSAKNLLLNFYDNTPNTFIGANDYGKSAILKAIGLLFDPKQSINIQTEGKFSSDISNTPIEEDDYSIIFKNLGLSTFSGHNSNAVIVGELMLEKDDLDTIYIDNLSTQLKWSIENLNEKKLYLLRTFDNDTPYGKFFIYCKDEISSPMQLWNQNQNFLREKVSELKITEDEIKNDNRKGKFTNLEKIRAIYKRVKADFIWSDYSEFKKDKDKGFFPTYLYIDWNTSLKHLEELASAAMASKIETHKISLQASANTASDSVTDEVNHALESMVKELSLDLPNINSIKAKVNFSIMENITDLVITKNTSDGDIRMDSQGEGIKKQIMFALLKWTSLKEILPTEHRKRYIWCFDEPEVHLYPSAQRELYRIIKKLSSNIYQVFLSTHSTIFVNKLNIDQIKQVFLNNGYSEITQCVTVDDIHSALGVKNSDFLFFDKFLLFEGPTEEVLIPYFYTLYKGRTLEEDNIQIINLGGKSKFKENKKLFENLLKDFKKTELYTRYILDADSNIKEKNVHLVGTYDIEDSLPDKIWVRFVEDCAEYKITTEELKKIREDLGPSNGKKFYKQLMDLINTKSDIKQYLPSKGRDSAQLIKTCVTDVKDIPQSIIEAFDALD